LLVQITHICALQSATRGRNGPTPERRVFVRLQARALYHRKRNSIQAHLTIVLAALAVSLWIETTTDWSIKTSVRSAAATAPSPLRRVRHRHRRRSLCPATSRKP